MDDRSADVFWSAYESHETDALRHRTALWKPFVLHLLATWWTVRSVRIEERLLQRAHAAVGTTAEECLRAAHRRMTSVHACLEQMN